MQKGYKCNGEKLRFKTVDLRSPYVLTQALSVFILTNCYASTPIIPSQSPEVIDPLQIRVITSQTKHEALPELQIKGLELKWIAGSGQRGYKDGLAYEAHFNDPAGIAKDPQGNLYISDSGNNRIRKINMDGLVSTVSGSGRRGFNVGKLLETDISMPSDLAFLPPSTLYVKESTYILRMHLTEDKSEVFIRQGPDSDSNVKNPPIEFSGGQPKSMVYHKNSWYISLNHEIKKIQQLKDSYQTFHLAGTSVPTTSLPDDPNRYFRDGTAQEAIFNQPEGISLDTKGNVYVADASNHRIRMIENQSNKVTTFAGSAAPEPVNHLSGFPNLEGGFRDGDVKAALFSYPTEIIVNKDDIILVLDLGNRAVRLIHKGHVSTLMKNANVVGLFLDENTLYMCDVKLPRVYKMDISQLKTLIEQGSAR